MLIEKHPKEFSEHEKQVVKLSQELLKRVKEFRPSVACGALSTVLAQVLYAQEEPVLVRTNVYMDIEKMVMRLKEVYDDSE